MSVINPQDITFVMQGAYIPQIVEQNIAAIRTHMPLAKIIFSCCGAAPTLPSADLVVASADPGTVYNEARPNNINRQLVNTLAGLRAVTTPYAFKIRADFTLTGSDFLQYYGRYPKQDPDYALFSHPVLACCYFSRNPRMRLTFPFHPSDFAFFGRTADLIKLFDIPLMTDAEARWFTNRKRHNRYCAEQHLFINALRQNGHTVACDFHSDVTAQSLMQSEKYLASNFTLLNFEQFNLYPIKTIFHLNIYPSGFTNCYTHADWLALYRQYVDPSVALPPTDVDRAVINAAYRRYKKYRFLGNMLSLPLWRKEHKRKVRNTILEYFLHD